MKCSVKGWLEVAYRRLGQLRTTKKIFKYSLIFPCEHFFSQKALCRLGRRKKCVTAWFVPIFQLLALRSKFNVFRNFRRWGKIRHGGAIIHTLVLPLNSNAQLKKMSIF